MAKVYTVHSQTASTLLLEAQTTVPVQDMYGLEAI